MVEVAVEVIVVVLVGYGGIGSVVALFEVMGEQNRVV